MSDEISPAAKELMRVIGNALADWIVMHLAHANHTIQLHLNNPDISYMRGKSADEIFEVVLHDLVHKCPLKGLGVHRRIIIDISAFSTSEEIQVFTRDRKALVPTKLIQTLERPVTRQAGKEFSDELSRTCQAVLARELRLKDIGVKRVFVGELELHRKEQEMDPDQECCIFRLIEADYEMPYSRYKAHNEALTPKEQDRRELMQAVFKSPIPNPQERHKYALPEVHNRYDVIDFSIICKLCGGRRHEFKLVR